MKSARVLPCLAGTLLLSACSGMTAVRGQCEFMLPVERDRCLRANESSRDAVKTRAEERRAAERPISISDPKAPPTESPDDKWIP
jgi:hypothetical protein